METRIDNRSMFYGADSKTFGLARRMRREMTLAEMMIWKKLRDRNLFNTKFRRQHPVNIFIVDFYCHEYKLAIEIDGEVHQIEEIHEYDLNRSAELEKFGINVIRFTNDQVLNNIDIVILKIQELTNPK
jgi:very-short-patch-repair endonuclease